MNNIPKTAVIGAGGFLGNRLMAAHRAEHPDCIGTFYSSGEPVLDLFEPDISQLNLKETGHQDVIIAAGVIDIYKCEFEKESTYAVNVTGTLELIRQITDEGLKPIFLSTDWVFRGDRGDYDDNTKADPICEYGAQKAEIEKAIPDICDANHLIVRLSRMFSLRKGDNSTPDQIARLLSQGKTVCAARDQIFSPLLVDDAVEAILGLQRAGAKGVINVNSPEVYSRLEMANTIADLMGVHRSLVESVALDELDNISRPKRTNMLCDRLNKLLPMEFTPLSKCLKTIAENYRYQN